MKSFDTESSGYQKTILSDLQAALTNFRDTVADNAGFEGWEKVLFHTDEAMSWETVRNLTFMPRLVLNHHSSPFKFIDHHSLDYGETSLEQPKNGLN